MSTTEVTVATPEVASPLESFISKLELDAETGGKIRALVEPVAERIFGDSTNWGPNETVDTSEDADGKGYANDNILGVVKSVQIPSMLSVTLASEVCKLLLGEHDGWVGPLSPDYIKLCEFNW